MKAKKAFFAIDSLFAYLAVLYIILIFINLYSIVAFEMYEKEFNKKIKLIFLYSEKWIKDNSIERQGTILFNYVKENVEELSIAVKRENCITRFVTNGEEVRRIRFCD